VAGGISLDGPPFLAGAEGWYPAGFCSGFAGPVRRAGSGVLAGWPGAVLLFPFGLITFFACSLAACAGFSTGLPRIMGRIVSSRARLTVLLINGGRSISHVLLLSLDIFAISSHSNRGIN
jgi:hypothetical protein